ncbi:MAG: anti-sigma factor, partial [Pyrinomonadaceae bacterium]
LEELSANLNFRTDDSFDIAAAAIGLADLEIEPMPAHLNANILASADSYFASAESAAGSTERAVETAEADDMQPTFGFEPKRSSLSSWLGWAIAGAACIALAFNVYTTRFQGPTEIVKGPTPTVTPEKPSPAKLYEEIASMPTAIKANFGALPTAPADLKNVGGDVVWSDERQAGYMKLRNLPKNDKNLSTYQLWVFEENQGDKTPIDGGTFDVDADGDVIIPIDAKLKAKNPAMFAITVEKPGGVVVSDRKKIAALAKVAKTET